MILPIHFTVHAFAVMEERGIRRKWIERVLAQPEWTEDDQFQAGVVLAFGHIEEFGGRVLRVVYNDTQVERRIITAFFDRNRGRKGALP